MSNVKKIEKYLELIAAFETEESAYQQILHPEFQQTEHPNLLNKLGQKSSRSELFQRMKSGKAILSEQKYIVLNFLEQSTSIAVQARWTGVMAVDAGPLKKGQRLSAHFAMFFETKNELLFRQTNYDCFEPFN